MPAINRRTNPTKALSIAKESVTIQVNRAFIGDPAKSFHVERLDIGAYQLDRALSISCLAKAGKSAQYFSLGTVGQLDRSPKFVSELAQDKPIRFRLTIFDASTGRIVADVDNIKVLDEDSDVPSLVDIEPRSLDGPLWRLEMSAEASEVKPVLLVEQDLFPSGRAAINDKTFVAMVFPEVMRQIAARVAEHRDAIDDEGTWVSRWRDFFDRLNPSGGDTSDFDDDGESERWVEQCVKAFCRRPQTARVIASVTDEGKGV